MDDGITRRALLKKSLFGLLAPGIMKKNFKVNNHSNNFENADELKKYNIYWGDIHNHNSVGYAKGSLERSFDIAKSHLDFFAFTPHSQWHDMPLMEQDKHMTWVKGFEVTKKRWTDVQKMCANYNKPGEFVTFPAYEWHSSFYGDYCIYFPYDYPPLEILSDIEALKKFARKNNAIIIPHHPGYRQGNRGANFTYLDTEVSPVLEIYSEHGSAEKDNATYGYIRHSMGGVWAQNTLQYALSSGYRLGVIACSDDHLGYPGAYGEGLCAVLSSELTRDDIFDAIKKRRTYGVTGDRIKLNFNLNGHIMGEVIPFVKERKINVDVSGWDIIDRVEVLKNNEVVHRDFPIDRRVTSASWDKPILLRIEFGWGPWATLGMSRIIDWEIDVKISGGVLNEVYPCFQSGPFEESRRNLIKKLSGNSCHITSYTSREEAFAEKPTNAVVLNISGNPEIKLSLNLSKPKNMEITKSLKELVNLNEIIYTGPFPDESILIHPIVFSNHFNTEFSFIDDEVSTKENWYYIRVMQNNGQLAWSSPIWVEKD